MAGAFSGHLIDSFLTAQQQSRSPFNQPPTASPDLAVHGGMSFAPQMHGSFGAPTAPPPAPQAAPAFQDISEATARQIATLQAKLNKKLGPEYISQRPGPGGGPKLTYAEGWKIINLANEVFGFNGWSSSIVSLTTDYFDCNEQSQRYNVGVTAIVRVTLRDGVFHEDIGYGMLENGKSKGAALDKCKKEAVTDGVKRALRNFGNLLGNCLYDKQYTQEVTKIKVTPPKFDPSELHRRPEFDPNKNTAAPSGPATSTSAPVPAPASANNPSVSTNQSAAQSMPPPPHPRTPFGGTARSENPAKSNIVPTDASHAATNASSSATKPTVNQTAQNPVNNPPPQQQQKPTSRIIYEPKHPPQAAAPSTSVPASERRVSFAPAPQPSVAGPSAAAPPQPRPSVAQSNAAADDDDESFGLHSEDDAFYASLDLGEAAADIGRPIDYGEPDEYDLLNCTQSDYGELPSVLGGQQPPAPAPAPVPQPQQQQAQQQSRPSVPQQSRPAPGPPHKFVAQPANVSPGQPGQQLASPSANQPARSSQASSGAFHFPKGPQSNQSAKPLSGGAGVKRPADAIRETPARRPAQGMGLSHASGTRREPLAMVELTEGGDVKRVKR